jgi:hypothetical protein
MERLRRAREDDREPGERRSPAVPELPAERLLALQRGAGNAAVARMLSASGRRMLARTTVRFNSSDLEKVMHILPWKHGWDELIDLALDMRPGGQLRPEKPGLLTAAETESLKEDYEKVKDWLRTALRSDKLIKIRRGTGQDGEIWQFKYVVPKEDTRRGVKSFTIFMTGLRPFKEGTKEPEDRYSLSDAWVETDRREFLKQAKLQPDLDFETWRAAREGAAK